MNLNHLAVFHAVMESGSVTAAAERLMISQPAVSKQLKEIERSFGSPLFDRLPRGMRPTRAGTLLAGYAKRLFALADEADSAMREMNGLQRGHLALAASTTVGVYLLPEMFVRFRREFPAVKLDLEIADSRTIQRRLLDGDIDAGLTEGLIADQEIEATVFMEESLVAIAPYGHPLSRAKSVSVEKLCAEPFVVRETGSETKSMVEQDFVQRGVAIRAAMSLGSTEAIKRAVAAGMGIAIVPRLAVELELQARRLAVIRVQNLNLTRPIHWVHRRGAHSSRALVAFREMLESQRKRT